jgi:hypothetical protein
MRIKPKVSSRIDPAKLGIDIENEELKKIKENTDQDGKLDLAAVYDIPLPSGEDSKTKTLVKYMERDGLEYGEEQYRKEYQLKAAHQIIISGGTTSQIAQALSITLNAAKNLRRELTARQLNEIKNFNAQQEIAKAIMFYDHIGAKALQMTSKGGNNALRTQVEALKVALQAQSDKQKFLTLAGAYETGLRSGLADDRHINDANTTRDMLTGVLSGGTYEVVQEDDELEDGIEIL